MPKSVVQIESLSIREPNLVKLVDKEGRKKDRATILAKSRIFYLLRIREQTIKEC